MKERSFLEEGPWNLYCGSGGRAASFSYGASEMVHKAIKEGKISPPQEIHSASAGTLGALRTVLGGDTHTENPRKEGRGNADVFHEFIRKETLVVDSIRQWWHFLLEKFEHNTSRSASRRRTRPSSYPAKVNDVIGIMKQYGLDPKNLPNTPVVKVHVFNTETGKVEILPIDPKDPNVWRKIAATANCVPYFDRSDLAPYIDPAIDGIPLREMIERGKWLIVLNDPKKSEPPSRPGKMLRSVESGFLPPEIRAKYREQPERMVAQEKELATLEEKGQVIVLRPEREFAIPPHSNDAKKIWELQEHGRELLRKLLEERTTTSPDTATARTR